MATAAAVLLDVEAAAQGLLETSLGMRVGAASMADVSTAMNGSAATREARHLQLLALQQHAAWLERVLVDYEAGVFLSQETREDERNAAAGQARPGDDMDEAEREVFLGEELARKQEEYLNEFTQAREEELLLARVRENHALLADVFPDGEDDDDEAKEFLRSLLHQRDARVSELMFEQSRLRNVQEQNRAIEERITALQADNRVLFKEVKRLERAADQSRNVLAPEIERKEKRVRMLTGHGALLRYVLQGLVAESGLNWAADPELRRIMLTLEDPEAAGEE